MKCQKCKFDNLGGMNFCGKCGTKLETVCSQCAFSNPAGYEFCGKCGCNLSLPSEPPSKDLSIDQKIEKIQKYLPKGLAKKILSQRDRIEGERKQVTVMFCDMEGFTALSDKLSPEDAYSLMDQVYEILIHKVHDYGGTVNEMTGDGIMALFGAPIALEDAPQRSIRSAISIHREMLRFNDKIRQEKSSTPSLKMRIGIHTGPVVVGTLGNDLRVDFKAVGDTVNLASRIEGLAEPGTTYVTGDTFSLSAGLFRFEALGEKKVKGKEAMVEVYRVIAPSTLNTRFEVSAEKGLTFFVGRDRELELLLDGFERAKAGCGQAFSIVAEAGVGKTRLLYEFRKALTAEDITFREGRCLSYAQGEAYYPITDILKSNFDIRAGDGDLEIRKKVARGLRIIKADEASTLPYLLELFAVKESGLNEISTPEERKYRFIEATKRIILKGSEVRPVVMAIEDLHWLDKSSEEILKGLFDSIAGSRIMLIFTYRPEFVHTWGAKSFHNQLNLNRLSNRESLLMVSHLLDRCDILKDIEDLILEKTEGVPFFIEELIKSLKELKIISRDGNKYDLTKGAKELVIPSTIQDVIMSRVDSLPDSAKEVLQFGSSIEREFSYDVIMRVTGLSEQELLSNLSLLKDSELVYERGIYPQSSYIFKHALTREVVYDSILTERKKKIHETIGHSIEELYPTRLEEFYEILAYHYSKGDSFKKAFKYLKLSGEKANAIYAYVEAIRSFEEAIKVQEVIDPENKKARFDLQIELCDCLLMAGDSKRIIGEEAPKAFSLAEEMGDRVRAARISFYISFWAILYHGVGMGWGTPEALLWAERANSYADPDTRERVYADIAMGITCCYSGNSIQGIMYLNRAIDSPRLIGDNEMSWLVNYAWVRCIGSPQHAIKSLNIAEEIMAKSRIGVNLRTLQIALWNIMCTFLSQGIRHRAEEVMDEIRDLAGRTNHPYIFINSLCCDCLTAMIDGRLEEAVDINRRIVQKGAELNISYYTDIFAQIIGMRPRLHLGKAENILRDSLAKETRLEMKSFYLAKLGQVEEANETIDLVMKARSKIKLDEDETRPFLDISLLEASLLTGNHGVAERSLKRFTGSLIKTTGRWHTTCIDRHLGAAAEMLGRYDEARSHYHEALKVATDMRFRPEIALTRFQLAELLFDNYPEARPVAIEHLDFAINEFREIKMQPSIEKAQVLKDKISA